MRANPQNPLLKLSLENDGLKKSVWKWRLAFGVLLALFAIDFYGTYNKAVENKMIIKEQNETIAALEAKIYDANLTKQKILKAINDERKGSTELNNFIASELLKAAL